MLSQWIHQGLVYITNHPNFGYIFSFCISFLESLPIIGTIIPGSITMTAVGTLIGTGTLPLTPTILSAICGAFFGDFIGFLVGRLGEERIFSIWPFKKNKHWLEYGRSFFQKHGIKSVIIGRFIGPIRSAIPMIASLLGMSYSKFIIAGICSATLWSILYITPGILLGRFSNNLSNAMLAKWITGVLICLAIITALYILFHYSYNYYTKHLEPKLLNYWNHLYSKHKLLQHFISDHFLNSPLPLLLMAWLLVLTCFTLIFLLIQPLATATLQSTMPDIWLHSVLNYPTTSIFKLAIHNYYKLFIILSLFITLICITNIKKAFYSLIWFMLVWVSSSLALGPHHFALMTLVSTNLVLWIPLSISCFIKPSKYNQWFNYLFILYGLVTLYTNFFVIMIYSASFNTLILSWLLSAILISLFCLGTYFMANKQESNKLDSIIINIPALLLAFVYFTFL